MPSYFTASHSVFHFLEKERNYLNAHPGLEYLFTPHQVAKHVVGPKSSTKVNYLNGRICFHPNPSGRFWLSCRFYGQVKIV